MMRNSCMGSWWEILAWARPHRSTTMCSDKRQVEIDCCSNFLDSTGTPDCAWVYTHRPTAVSLHFAPCCTARDLTNWHRQAVQFSSHLTHTSRLHLSLRLPSHIVTQSNFCALRAECRLNLYCHIHQATVTSRDFQRMPQHIRDPFKISEKWKTNPSTVCYANALLQVVHRCTEL